MTDQDIIVAIRSVSPNVQVSEYRIKQARAVLAARLKEQLAKDSAPKVHESLEKTKALIAGRFSVEKTNAGFWSHCVKTSGTNVAFVGREKQCLAVAQALQTACLDGAYLFLNEVIYYSEDSGKEDPVIWE